MNEMVIEILTGAEALVETAEREMARGDLVAFNRILTTTAMIVRLAKHVALQDIRPRQA